MATIPDEIKQKISFRANQLFNHSESDGDATDKLLLRVYPDAAEFGYSLAEKELAEKDEKIKALENVRDSINRNLRTEMDLHEACAKQLTLTESHRKEWADMCVKKQARIEELGREIIGLNTLHELAAKEMQSDSTRIKALEEGLRQLDSMTKFSSFSKDVQINDIVQTLLPPSNPPLDPAI